MNNLKPIEYEKSNENDEDKYYNSSHDGTSFAMDGFSVPHDNILAHKRIRFQGIDGGALRDAADIMAPLGYVGQGDKLEEMDLKGKIAVYEMKFKPKGLKTYSKILFIHDPDSTLESSARVVRAALEFEYKMYEILKAKEAVGMVGLLSGLQWDSDRYYPQMSFGLEKSIPGVWVRPSHCDRVRKWSGKDNAVANLVMTADRRQGHLRRVP